MEHVILSLFFGVFKRSCLHKTNAKAKNSLPLRSVYTVLKLHWGPSCTKQTRKHPSFMRTLRLQPPYVFQ